MKTQTSLTSDLKISRIITGLWQIADIERNKKIDPKEYSRTLTPYVDAGFTTFDMADHYGSSELILGHFNSENPTSNLTLLTKWVPKPGPVSRNMVKEAVHLALKRLKRPNIDLLQYHAWHYPDPSWIDALCYLKELKDEGLIKHIGVTNFDAAHLRIALTSGIPIVSNQISHSILDDRARSKEMEEVCKKFNVKLIAYGVVMGGFLTQKWLGKSEPTQESLKTWSEMKYKRFIDASGGWEGYQNILGIVDGIARDHNASIANICSKFVLDNPMVSSIIIGARLGESDHIKENTNILSIDLSDAQRKTIEEAQKSLKAIPGNCGDEYRKTPYLTASGDLSHHYKKIPKVFDQAALTKQRMSVSSGTKWESIAGYSRAIKHKNRILVSGTTATHRAMLIGSNDAAAQTYFILDKIEAAIGDLGGSLSDVVRTRIYIKNLSDWESVAKAHGEKFIGINPANTMVKAGLIGDEYLVEIEAEAEST